MLSREQLMRLSRLAMEKHDEQMKFAARVTDPRLKALIERQAREYADLALAVDDEIARS